MIKKYYKRKFFSTGLLVLILVLLGSDFFPALGQGKIIQEVTFQPDEIKAAVETWVRVWTPDARPDAEVELLEPYYEDGQTYAYIAHLMGGGFCLCGASNLVLCVYLYSPEGTYDPKDPGCAYMLQEIATRTRYLQNALAQNDPQLNSFRDELVGRSNDWVELAGGRVPDNRVAIDQTPDPVKVELKLACKWTQYYPYNDACPALSPSPWDDEHALVGCNQTAMAQMMYYWQWPNQGEGSHWWYYDIHWLPVGFWISESLATDPGIPANWPVGPGLIDEAEYERMRWDAGTQTLQVNGYWDESIYWHAGNISSDPDYQAALDSLYNRLPVTRDDWTIDLGNTTYDWSIIPAQCTDPLDAGDAEAAKLCFHIGITVEGEWGIGGTTGSHEKQAEALKSHFRYHDDAMQQDCDPNDMVEELQWMRAVGMGGDLAADGGHGWVVHGYDASFPDWRFLMNMGWGGSDVWRSLDNVPGGFHFNQSNLIRVAPLNVLFVGNAHPGDGSPDNPCENIEEALAQVPDGGTLIFKAGSVNTFDTGTLVINRPLKLKGYNAIIQ